MKISLPTELQDLAPQEPNLTWKHNSNKHRPQNFEPTCNLVAVDIAKQWTKALTNKKDPFLSTNVSNELEKRIKEILIASPHLPRTFAAYKEQRNAEEAKIEEASTALNSITSRPKPNGQAHTIPERQLHPHGSIEERVDDILLKEFDIAAMKEREGIAAARSQHAQDVLNANSKRPYLIQKLTAEVQISTLTHRLEEAINNELQGMSIDLRDYFKENTEAKAFLERMKADPSRHASQVTHDGGLTEFDRSEARRTGR